MILLLIALIHLIMVSFGNDGFIKDDQAYILAIFIEFIFEIPIGCYIGYYFDSKY